MTFYREATVEDFENKMKQFEWIPEEVRKILDEGNKPPREMTDPLRCQHNLSLMDVNRVYQEYMKTTRAFRDFQNGNRIYTEY